MLCCEYGTWTFSDQVVKVGKGWVGQEFVLFDHRSIAKWNRVAKWVNILQDIDMIKGFMTSAPGAVVKILL
jgi:hypothetical protein